MRLIALLLFCLISSPLLAGNKASATTYVNASHVSPVPAKKSIVFHSLQQFDALIKAGVPALALSLLETQQNKRPRFTAEWYAFEYKRIIIYASMKNWSALNKRVNWLLHTAALGTQITEKISLWFETQQVIARLRSGQAQSALQQLEGLIWNHKTSQIDKSLPALWRRLVIRSYVQLKLYEDAQKALVKYNQDFKVVQKDTDWQLLQARVLLDTGRPEQASRVLASIVPAHLSADVRALKLLAQLQSETQVVKQQLGLKRIEAIAVQVRKLTNTKLLASAARWDYAYVGYRAALILNNTAAQISYLEIMLSLAPNQPPLGKNYTVSVDSLWNLYKKTGLSIANAHNLLIGDDSAWRALIKTFAKDTTRFAFYLNVALAVNTQDKSIQQETHAAIVNLLAQKKHGLALINQLYLHSREIHDLTVLPAQMRYRLVDYALSRGNIRQAGQLMNSLPEPPAGQTMFDWRMRKARVLVFEGDYKQSAMLLRDTITPLTELKPKSLDRYIQVVFDFQTVQQHQLALQLFDLIKAEWLTAELKREIYFWKAESYIALDKYDLGAFYYLKSAQALVGKDNDIWGQSARFKAAGALVKAGIYTDAEKVYKDLLKITVSSARRALIKQKLQYLSLLKHAQQHAQKSLKRQEQIHE